MFKEMPIDADIHSYNAIIHLCVDEGNFKEAQEYYDRLCAIRSPNAITYSHLVLGYYRVRLYLLSFIWKSGVDNLKILSMGRRIKANALYKSWIL